MSYENSCLCPPPPKKKLICKARQPPILRGTGTGFFHVGSFLFSFSLSGKRQLFNFPHLEFPCGVNVHHWQPGYHRKQNATVAIPVCPRNTDLSTMKAPGCSNNKVGFRSSRKKASFTLCQVPAVKVNTYECGKQLSPTLERSPLSKFPCLLSRPWSGYERQGF